MVVARNGAVVVARAALVLAVARAVVAGAVVARAGAPGAAVAAAVPAVSREPAGVAARSGQAPMGALREAGRVRRPRGRAAVPVSAAVRRHRHAAHHGAGHERRDAGLGEQGARPGAARELGDAGAGIVARAPRNAGQEAGRG